METFLHYFTYAELVLLCVAAFSVLCIKLYKFVRQQMKD
jgi:hypothetical protein